MNIQSSTCIIPSSFVAIVGRSVHSALTIGCSSVCSLRLSVLLEFLVQHRALWKKAAPACTGKVNCYTCMHHYCCCTTIFWILKPCISFGPGDYWVLIFLAFSMCDTQIHSYLFFYKEYIYLVIHGFRWNSEKKWSVYNVFSAQRTFSFLIALRYFCCRTIFLILKQCMPLWH